MIWRGDPAAEEATSYPFSCLATSLPYHLPASYPRRMAGWESILAVYVCVNEVHRMGNPTSPQASQGRGTDALPTRRYPCSWASGVSPCRRLPALPRLQLLEDPPPTLSPPPPVKV